MSGTIALKGTIAVLGVLLGAAGGWAQTPDQPGVPAAAAVGLAVPQVTGTSAGGGCAVVGFDAVAGPFGAGGGSANTVDLTLPCTGPVIAQLTSEVNPAPVVVINFVATCLAPVAPGGCTVTGSPVLPTPSGMAFTSNGASAASGVFTSLPRGLWRFEAQAGGSGALMFRVFTVQAFGTLPVTPPGSSQ